MPRQQSFTNTLTRMGHDIKRIADDEWESSNPIDFRGTQTKNNYAQRAWSDWNDDDYLALGVNAMRETGDKSGQYALYNAGTDSRKALDIAHLNLDDYYGSHITGAGKGNAGSAYAYDASALKRLPKDIGKLSTNEQMDTPAQTKANYKTQRRSLGLPDVIPTITKPTEVPHEVEEEQDAPPEEGAGDPHAKPPKSEADEMAERMAEASKKASKAGEASVGVSSSGVGDAGGTVQFEKEELDTMRTAGGRTINTDHPAVKKGIKLKAVAPEAGAPPKGAMASEKKKDDEASGSEGSEAGSESDMEGEYQDYEDGAGIEVLYTTKDIQSILKLAKQGKTIDQIAKSERFSKAETAQIIYDFMASRGKEYGDEAGMRAGMKEREREAGGGEAKDADYEGEDDGEDVATSRAGGGGGGGFKAGHTWKTRSAELLKAFPGIKNLHANNKKEVSYSTLSTGQKRFMVAIAQGKPGRPSDDLMMNYEAPQGDTVKKQHDYMIKLIDAHDKKEGKKGLTGWATNLTEVSREIPSLSLGKLFSLSPEGRNMVYQSTKAMGAGWFSPGIKALPDHDLDVLLTLYKSVMASPTATRGEKSLASAVEKNAEGESKYSFGERMKRLKAKGYEKK